MTLQSCQGSEWVLGTDFKCAGVFVPPVGRHANIFQHVAEHVVSVILYSGAASLGFQTHFSADKIR